MENNMFLESNNLNLPHDVVKLPSKGLFYKPKKESLKVGYLTANDENLLISPNTPKDGLVTTLLRNKIYEPGFDINQLLECDIQAILLFLRNTAFGSDYVYSLTDPSTKMPFETTIVLDEVNFKKPLHEPDINGHFSFYLKKSKVEIKCKLLTLKENNEIDKLRDSYPKNMVAPIVTKRLETSIVEINGNSDRQSISTFVNQMPISDSKELKKFLKECEPGLDLEKKVIAPSGEEVTINVAFGVEFFRPFFEF